MAGLPGIEPGSVAPQATVLSTILQAPFCYIYKIDIEYDIIVFLNKQVMLMSVGNCTSCGTTITAGEKFARFPCPSCGEETMLRCESCKKTANKYKCKKCGFEGP